MDTHGHTRTQTRLINTSEIFESGFKPSESRAERRIGGKGAPSVCIIMFCLQFEKFCCRRFHILFN